MPKGQSPRENQYAKQKAKTQALLRKVNKDISSLDIKVPKGTGTAGGNLAGGITAATKATRQAIRALTGKESIKGLKTKRNTLERNLANLENAKKSTKMVDSTRAKGQPARLPKAKK